MDTVRFGELYAIPSGNGLSRPSAVRGEGYRMIGMGELFASDIILDTEMDRVQMSERELKTFLVEEGDLLFARQSLVAEGAGKCSIVKRLSEPTTYESHLIRVRLDQKKCNPWFYYYLFKLPNNPIKAIVNQCAQAGIRGNELIKVKVPLLDRPIQDRITSILSVYDNLIEVNNKRIKVLEQMAENLYKEWFVRFRFPGHESIPFENGLPQGWKQDTASSVFNITIGKTPPRKEFEWFTENDPNAVNWVSVSDMKNAYVFTTDEQLTRTAIDRFNMIVVPKNTVLLSFKLTVGRVSIAQTPCATNEAIAHFGGMSETYREFLYYQLKNYDYSKLGNTSSIGNAVNSKVIKNMKLLYPEEIVLRRFHETSKPLVDEIICICSQNQILICQRDLLLPRLMSGKLEV